MKYPLILSPDSDGSLLVTSPDFPELTTFGSDEADALRHGADALQEAIAARMDSFAEIPRPSAGGCMASVPLALALKVELFWALTGAGMTRADLCRATGWHRNTVDRLFDPNHENKLAQIEAAFAALDRTIAVELEPA